MTYLDEHKGLSYTREYERREILTKGKIKNGQCWHDCLIINLSVRGAKIRIDSAFQQGGDVLLQIGNFGEFDGVVAWHNAQDIGITFTNDPAEMADVVMGLATYG